MRYLSFWTREIIGWLLVGLGLYGYWIALAFLAAVPARLIEGGIAAGVSTMIFRGGLQLIRVATAARVVIAAANALPGSVTVRK